MRGNSEINKMKKMKDAQMTMVETIINAST